jgi:ATP-binding cassette subfamily B protein
MTIQRDTITFSPWILWRITRLGFRYPWRLGAAMVFTLIASIFSLIVPRLLGRAVDEAHGLLLSGAGHAGDARQALLRTALLLLGASVARGLFTMIHGYQAEVVGQRVGYDLRLAFFEKLQRLSFGFHDRVHSGDLITRGMLDLEGTRIFIEGGLLRLALLAMLIGVGAFLLLSADPLIGLLALSFAPFAGWKAGESGLLLRLSWRRLQEFMSILTRVMEENLQGIRVVRAFSAKPHEMGKFDAAAADALSLANQRIALRVKASSAMTIAYFTSMGLVLWVGGHKVLDGEMTIGKLAEFLSFMTILQAPVRQIGLVVNATARAMSSGARLFEILDLEPEIRDAPGAPDLAVARGVLRFENVDFAYEAGPAAKKVLSGISFEVGPGKTLGIVGPPGSGKSTIAHLIPRFYDATGGKVTIDGQDVRDVTLESLRRAVGVIQQDTFLFASSVAENVAYADPWAADESIVEAATSAQIHDYIAALPEAYGTSIGERGISLSGGQRQRLSIARGIISEPAIIVFDDSMAAIDAATEQRVRQALRHATRDKATIIIAHRLSSLRDADEIIVLDHGEIVERGTHQDLLAARGHYRALHDLQRRSASGADTIDDPSAGPTDGVTPAEVEA